MSYTKEQLKEVETLAIRATGGIGYNFIKEYDYDYEAFKIAYDTPDVGKAWETYAPIVRGYILAALEMSFKDIPLHINDEYKLREMQVIPPILKWRLELGR
jgi:hypothetical protein